MAIHEFTATISPGQTHRWWFGGGWNGWYTDSHKPQLDAYPVPTFPEGISFTGIKVPLWYGDFSCQVEYSDFLGTTWYTYYMTVKNIGSAPAMYRARVWVP